MKSNDETTQGKASRSFAQEMQQAVADWVRKLPFLKRNLPEDPDRDTPGEVSTEDASVPRRTEGAPSGTPSGNEGRPG